MDTSPAKRFHYINVKQGQKDAMLIKNLKCLCGQTKIEEKFVYCDDEVECYKRLCYNHFEVIKMSGEVILICGKICSGKTYLAKRLCDEKNAVLLSCDELMLTVFDPYLGDDFDRVSKKCMDYLFKKAACIAKSGINVILDWGFWKRKDRDEAKAFFKEEDIKTTLYYIDVENEQWLKNIQKRNTPIKRVFRKKVN